MSEEKEMILKIVAVIRDMTSEELVLMKQMKDTKDESCSVPDDYYTPDYEVVGSYKMPLTHSFSYCDYSDEAYEKFASNYHWMKKKIHIATTDNNARIENL